MDVKSELESLFNDPLLNVTYQEAKLFDFPADMKRVMEARRIQPDHYAEKKVCEDFDLYRPLFAQVDVELKAGIRSLVRVSKTASFKEGSFYIMSGQMVYLDKIKADRRASNGLQDGRTRCIYDNGTESDILIQTLRTNVLNDGYGITDPQDESGDFTSTINAEDKMTGYLYVLQSLSADPAIAEQKDLYKIGFTTQEVSERIANAAHEPTYLMAPVRTVLTAKIVNMNSHIFEGLVHQIFDAVQFHVAVYDEQGEEHHPSEWYVAPLPIIETVIQKIADRTIVNYTYNAEQQCLERRVQSHASHFNTTGLKVLTLTIKKNWLDEIVSGEKKIEYRELKQTTLNRYTYVDEADNKRYLRRYDALRLRISPKGEQILIQVTNTTFDAEHQMVQFHLGQILEHT